MVNSKAHFQTAWGEIIHFFPSFIPEVLAKGLVCDKERKEESKSQWKPGLDRQIIFDIRRIKVTGKRIYD